MIIHQPEVCPLSGEAKASILAITAKHSLFPVSSTRYCIIFPCGWTATRAQHRTYQVPQLKHYDEGRLRLSTGGVLTTYERNPSFRTTHVPFGLGLSALLAYRSLRWLHDDSITLALLI